MSPRRPPVRGLYAITDSQPGDTHIDSGNSKDKKPGDTHLIPEGKPGDKSGDTHLNPEGWEERKPGDTHLNPEGWEQRWDPHSVVARVAPLVGEQMGVLQYRDKSGDGAKRLAEAAALASLCRRYGVLFLINDDVALARAVGADGVHLGRDDGSVAAARKALGPDAVIGASCYASLDLAGQMCAQGADYLAFGAVYPSATKPHAVRADLDLLREARARFDLPLVAIGGITSDNAAAVVATGVDAVAVINGLFQAPDPLAAARRIAALFH